MAQPAIDEGHFKALNAVVGDVGYEVDVLYVEFTFGNAFGKNSAKEFYLVFVEMLAHFFHHPDVSEKLGTQVSVAYDGLSYLTEVCVDEFDDFFLWADFLGRHLVELVGQTFQF